MKIFKKKEKDEIRFSWFNVAKRWGQNLRDDVDPALTGTKWGVYGIHAIPTLSREYNEGKNRTDKPLLSTLMAGIVGVTEAAGYWFAGQHVNSVTDSDVGYALIGVPLAMNGVSWAGEALKRAKKTEHGHVYLTRLQKSFEQPTGEYDLTCSELADKIVGKNVANEYSRHDISNREDAKKYLMKIATDVLEGISASGRTGKTYDLTTDLEAGPEAMRIRTKSKGWRGRYRERHDTSELASIIRKTVDENNGTANIEMFGEVTTVFSPEYGDSMHYRVKPNGIWR